MKDDPQLHANSIIASRESGLDADSSLFSVAPGANHHEKIVSEMAIASLSKDRSALHDFAHDALDGGMPPESLIDKVIPDVARLLGEHWVADSLSFAEVTIGSARLQALLRELVRLIPSDPIGNFDAPSVLMVIPPNCFHTLGAMIAISRFRRCGATVRLLITQDQNDLTFQLQKGHYDMVAISASGCESLETLRSLVTKVKMAGTSTPPVVIGGRIVEFEPNTKILVGADYTTQDPHEALELCGLTTLTPSAQYSAEEA